MGKFDLAAAMGLAKVSNLDTVETRMIDVDLLDANPVEDDLSDLCESIEVNGLLQPILVTPAEAGHYRIIAGHRRTAALKRLKEQDPERYRQAPCRITRPISPELEELMGQFIACVASFFRSPSGMGGNAGYRKRALGNAAS